MTRGGILDREGALAKLLIAPAVLYIVAMIGAPLRPRRPVLPERRHHRRPLSPARRLSELRRGAGGPRLPARPAEHLRVHAAFPVDRHRPVADSRQRPPQAVPGKVAGAIPHPAPVDGADLPRDDRLALDVRLDLQPHRLDAALPRAARNRGRPFRPADEHVLAGCPGTRDGVGHPRRRLAHPPPRDGHPAGGARAPSPGISSRPPRWTGPPRGGGR